MRVAVFLESSHDESGGGFQQSLSTVESLTRNGATKYDVVAFVRFEQTRQLLLKYDIEAVRFNHRLFRLLDRWSSTVLGSAIFRRLRRLGFRRLGRHLDALLDDHGVDVVVLNECSEIAWRIGDHPYIVAVWDLNHRDRPDFPEQFVDRVFERRERSVGVTLTRALAVVANSGSGARQIIDLYQVDPKRIVELPFLPSIEVRRYAAGQGSVTVEEARRKYRLPDRYVFYPAYFAPHKNHLYLLEGLVELERRHGIVLHAVFCGGGEPEDVVTVERQVEALRLQERVQFLGLIPDEDIPALYDAAVALVMPSYFGPTNLPPLEAVTVGCPVIYSDLPEFREQMGDAALYCDLKDVSNLAGHLAGLIQDSALSDRLRNEGRKCAAEMAKIDYGERLAPILDDFAYLRRRWTWPQKAR